MSPIYETVNEECREIRRLVLEPPRDTDVVAMIKCPMKAFPLNEILSMLRCRTSGVVLLLKTSL
jgi:hypothetical protein